jgi:uncharacterized membrane-anchored protein
LYPVEFESLQSHKNRFQEKISNLKVSIPFYVSLTCCEILLADRVKKRKADCFNMKTLCQFVYYSLLVLAMPLGIAQEAAPQEDTLSPEQKEFNKIKWEESGAGKLGSEAEIDIPATFMFTGRKGAETYLKLTGNLVGDDELGIIAPQELNWWVLFEFDKVGYVKDDEKIDAAKLLKQMQENQEAGNSHRKSQGLDALYIEGWQKEPFYNTETNNLEWAIRLRDEEGNQSVNYQTKILGRNGVMESVLLCSPDELDAVLPVYKKLLDGYRFTSGNKYSEFKDGDKVAKYGLAALIAGGGVAVAAKTGLLAGLFKVIAKGGKAVIVGVVAVLVAIWSGVKRLFGIGRE